MSKKTHDHKQLRALEKQRRIDRVSPIKMSLDFPSGFQSSAVSRFFMI